MEPDDPLLGARADQLHRGHLLALSHGVVERGELGRVDLERVRAVLLLGLLLGQADRAWRVKLGRKDQFDVIGQSTLDALYLCVLCLALSLRRSSFPCIGLREAGYIKVKRQMNVFFPIFKWKTKLAMACSHQQFDKHRIQSYHQ